MSSEETPKTPEAEEAKGTDTPPAAPAAEEPKPTAKSAPAEEPAEEPAAKEAKPAPAETPAAPASLTVAVATATPTAEDDTIRSSTYTPPVGGEAAAPSAPETPEVSERVVTINRCAKVVKGGRRFSFSALVVAGDRAGKVGYGFGKANEVAECIRKASESAQTSLQPIQMRGTTIPHETIGEYGGGKVMLRPASPGTGIIAGSSVRAVVEAAGITDILTKSLGSNNHFNVVKATLAGLRSLRSREQVYKLRGKKVAEKKAL